MEHESFEDEKVAEMMNSTFVSIKVDREEHPDIDNIYMMVCQMITGSGGLLLTNSLALQGSTFVNAVGGPGAGTLSFDTLTAATMAPSRPLSLRITALTPLAALAPDAAVDVW